MKNDPETEVILLKNFSSCERRLEEFSRTFYVTIHIYLQLKLKLTIVLKSNKFVILMSEFESTFFGNEKLYYLNLLWKTNEAEASTRELSKASNSWKVATSWNKPQGSHL